MPVKIGESSGCVADTGTALPQFVNELVEEGAMLYDYSNNRSSLTVSFLISFTHDCKEEWNASP